MNMALGRSQWLPGPAAITASISYHIPTKVLFLYFVKKSPTRRI